MAKKIEILENTLLKLLVRRGSDVDRKGVVLSQGELGYTADTERLFVGDGMTYGGSVVGNLAYRTGNIGTLVTSVTGDLAFDTNFKTLYQWADGGWQSIGGKYTAGDNTISIDEFNQIRAVALTAAPIYPGTVTTINDSDVYNGEAGTVFLAAPVAICTNFTTYSNVLTGIKMNTYPTISDITGLSTGRRLPLVAKSVIIEYKMLATTTPLNPIVIAGAPAITKLDTTNLTEVGDYEYQIAELPNSLAALIQGHATIPLSSIGNNSFFGLRISPWSNEVSINLRIIGYTK
jgi:hypothetical protein